MIWLLRCCLDHPRAALLATLVLTGLFAAGLPRLELRTDGELLRPEDSADIELDRRVSDRFGDPRWVWMLVEPRASDATLATPTGLRELRELDLALRELAVVQPDAIRSLPSLPRLLRGEGRLRSARQLDEIPDDPRGLDALLAEIDAQPLARGLLLSPDRRRALFALPLSEGVPVREAVDRVDALRARRGDAGLAVLLGGPLLAETMLGDAVLRDLATLVPLMVAVMSGLLALLLRCGAGVLIPMLEAGLVLVWTFGAMAWAGVPIALVTTVLPVVLMAMSITDEIHLLERLLGMGTDRPRRERIETAVRSVGRPIVLTSLTTAAGFLSFAGSPIPPLRHFGIFAAFGILAAMGLTFSAVPALALLLPESWLRRRSAPGGGTRAGRFARLAAARPGRLFAVGAGLFLAVSPGLLRLGASDSWVENFPRDAPLVAMERAVNESFWGSYRLDLVLEGEPGLFRRPEAIAYLGELRDAAARLPHVGGVETPREILAPVAAHLGAGRALDELSAAELADVFTVAEMTAAAPALRGVLAEDAALARVRLHVRSADYERAREVRRAVEGLLAERPPPGGARALFAGDLVVASAMVEAIVHSQLRSIASAVAIVALLLVAFGGGPAALPAMLPVAAATAGLLAAMGLLDVRLGIATSMFASLSVGVGVDFGIHFQHRFQSLRREGLGPSEAVVGSFAQAGRALRWNALVLAAGFGVLVSSALRPNHALGVLLSAATLACWVATALLLPWLLVRVARGAGGAAARGALAAALLGVVPMARAAVEGCPVEPDPGATRLMEQVERAARSGARVSRLLAETRYQPRRPGADPPLPPSSRILWSVVDGDVEATRLLFVFTGPGRMAGTSLLLRDHFGSSESDATWFYLRAFDHFERLEGAVERAIVPGTALTYEDARGYVATDRYHFAELEPPGAGRRRVRGCPRTPEQADRLGYGAIDVVVDPERRVVVELEYRGLGGAPLKRYELVESVETSFGVHPKRVRLVHLRKGFENDLHYEYWALARPPSDEIFAPDPEPRFLARLRALLHREGLGERVEAEIAEAEAVVRAHDRKFGGGGRKDAGEEPPDPGH